MRNRSAACVVALALLLSLPGCAGSPGATEPRTPADAEAKAELAASPPATTDDPVEVITSPGRLFSWVGMVLVLRPVTPPKDPAEQQRMLQAVEQQLMDRKFNRRRLVWHKDRLLVGLPGGALRTPQQIKALLQSPPLFSLQLLDDRAELMEHIARQVGPEDGLRVLREQILNPGTPRSKVLLLQPKPAAEEKKPQEPVADEALDELYPEAGGAAAPEPDKPAKEAAHKGLTVTYLWSTQADLLRRFFRSLSSVLRPPTDHELRMGYASYNEIPGLRTYYLFRQRLIGDEDVAQAREEIVPSRDFVALRLTLTQPAAYRLSQLTARQVGRRLAMVLLGHVQAAPLVTERSRRNQLIVPLGGMEAVGLLEQQAREVAAQLNRGPYLRRLEVEQAIAIHSDAPSFVQ